MDEQTLEIIQRYPQWRMVLLGSLSKKPIGSTWQITRVVFQISQHVNAGGNLGLLCGKESGVAVLDFDDLDAAQQMFEQLGPLPITVNTGSGKWHVYIEWQPHLPAKLKWNDRIVGDLQRGPKQQVVMPPSIHPNGHPYEWNRSLDHAKYVIPLPEVIRLPDSWRNYLMEDGADYVAVPEAFKPYLGKGTEGMKEEAEWEGPVPEEILRLASMQPGAKRRSAGVKFQCPECRNEGHDKHRDNAQVRLDGRWGCAYAPGDTAHKRSIGEALGIFGVDEELANELVSDTTARQLRERYFGK